MNKKVRFGLSVIMAATPLSAKAAQTAFENKGRRQENAHQKSKLKTQIEFKKWIVGRRELTDKEQDAIDEYNQVWEIEYANSSLSAPS